jgi:hypothetical protein
MAHELGGSLSPAVFVHGLSVALVVAAVIAFAGALIAVTTIRSHAGEPRVHEPEPAPAPAGGGHLAAR